MNYPTGERGCFAIPLRVRGFASVHMNDVCSVVSFSFLQIAATRRKLQNVPFVSWTARR